MNIKQVERGRLYPKEVAKSLKTNKILRRGFAQKTIEVCLSLGKGQYNIADARNRLHLSLSEFKDNSSNRKKRNFAFQTLEAFHEFIIYTELKCVSNYMKVRLDISEDRMITGHTCPIFKNANGRICGVIIVDGEYDYYSSLRAPLEKMSIAKKMNIKDINDIDIMLFHLDGFQHELLKTHDVVPEQIMKKVYSIFDAVEKELAA